MNSGYATSYEFYVAMVLQEYYREVEHQNV